MIQQAVWRLFEVYRSIQLQSYEGYKNPSVYLSLGYKSG